MVACNVFSIEYYIIKYTEGIMRVVCLLVVVLLNRTFV
jgi:hypothetical protein